MPRFPAREPSPKCFSIPEEFDSVRVYLELFENLFPPFSLGTDFWIALFYRNCNDIFKSWDLSLEVLFPRHFPPDILKSWDPYPVFFVPWTTIANVWEPL